MGDGVLMRLLQSFPGMAYRCRCDAEWTLEFASEGCLDLVGYSTSELVDEHLVTVSDLLHPDDMARVSLGVETALSERRRFALEYRVYTRDGSCKWIADVGQGVFDAEGNLQALEGFLSDVSALVAAKESARGGERREVVARMASGLAHDFNNILSAVLATAGIGRQLLRTGADPARVDAELAALESLAVRGGGLTKQLLTFGSPRAVSTDPVDLVEATRQLRVMLVRAVGSSISLSLELPSSPLTCRIDPVHFEQVLLNLAVNGRDAMPDGGELDITLSRDDAEGVARVRVQDNGRGIEAKALPQVFDPYFTTKGAEGTGLGLATIRAIVEEAGGAIRVQSTLGVGTRFEVTLPLLDAVTAHTPEFGTEVILLADDDADVRHAVARVLRRFGYTVLEAEDGEAALHIAEHHTGPLHLLLADGNMPKLGGVGLAEKLRESRPTIVSILMTGDSTRAAPTLFATTLSKPVTVPAMTAAIRSALDSA